MIDFKAHKIVVIGISGTGKSTIARKLSESTNIPVHHMDSIIWAENWTETSREHIELELEKIVKTKTWIVEGWIGTYSKSLMEMTDIIIYLDYSGWAAVRGGLSRWWRYRKAPRPELSAGCHDSWNFKFLRTMLLREERPHIESLLANWKLSYVKRCTSRKSADALVSQILDNFGNE